MKSLFLSTLLLAVAPLGGCASNGEKVVLAPVGPAPVEKKGDGSKGTLVVFSAFDPGAHFNSLPDRVFYTDYRILSEDGKPLRTVVNDTGTALEGPAPVELPAGAYRVIARANGYGEVTVPVVIAAGRTTAVHLEGGGSWGNEASMARANPVRLPDGRIAGWRAAPPSALQSDAFAPVRYHHETVSELTDGDTKFLRLVPESEPEARTTR